MVYLSTTFVQKNVISLRSLRQSYIDIHEHLPCLSTLSMQKLP